MKKGRYVVSLVLNVLVVAAVAFAVANIVFGFLPMDKTYAEALIGKNGSKLYYLFEYGVLAGLFGLVVALIGAVSDIVCLAKTKPTAKCVSVLRMVSAGVALAAIFKFFFIDSFAYQFISGRAKVFATADYTLYRNFLLDWHAPLYITVVAPALIIINYVFFQLDPKTKLVNVLWSFVPGVLYFGFMVVYDYLFVAAGNGALPSSHVFALFKFHSLRKWYHIAEVVGGGIFGIALATLVVFLLRKLVRKCAVKEKDVAPAKLEDVATKEEQPIKEETVSETTESVDSTEVEGGETSSPLPVSETKTPVATNTKPATAKPTTTKTTSSTAKPETKTASNSTKKTGKKVIILKTEGDKARAEGIDIKIDNGDEEAEEAAERRAEAKSTYKSVPRVYHISKQPSGKWQVKLATGERAIKLFDTQQQAIIYAKSLVKTQGGSIRIHAVSGKMRKE